MTRVGVKALAGQENLVYPNLAKHVRVRIYRLYGG
jgi:hypothetical protein